MKRTNPTKLDLYGTAICSSIVLIVAIASHSLPVILMGLIIAVGFVASILYNMEEG